MKVQKYAQGTLKELKIGHQLSFVDRKELIDSLRFDDDRVFDHDVCKVSVRNEEVSVTQRNGHLAFHEQTARPELECEASFVCALQQARTKMGMHLDRRVQDFA